MAESLECPVCLTLPEGEVHQCNEGHCYCIEGWGRLDPRRCPECRHGESFVSGRVKRETRETVDIFAILCLFSRVVSPVKYSV